MSWPICEHCKKAYANMGYVANLNVRAWVCLKCYDAAMAKLIAK
jgi:hypothetical protein